MCPVTIKSDSFSLQERISNKDNMNNTFFIYKNL